MIKKDAIEILKEIQDSLEKTRFLERCAIDMAIEALEERPHITDEQISDAFQLAIVNYWESKSKYLTPPPSPCCDCQTESLISRYQHDFISSQTETIKVGKPNGKWIRRHYITATKSFDMYVCSNCGEEFSYDAETGISMNNYNTCPHCGADMREGDEKLL